MRQSTDNDIDDPDAIQEAPTICSGKFKAILLSILVLCFLLQTWLVYADDPGPEQLSEQAIAGRKVWQRENCQACHQLYGFGGFLGPDLTNAASRLDRVQLDLLLTQGQGQMPPLHLPDDEIDALWDFLVAMNETGIGQARSPSLAPDTTQTSNSGLDPLTRSSALQSVAEIVQQSGDQNVQAGFFMFRTTTCVACHTLFTTSAVGAPDLTKTTGHRTRDEIDTVLKNGIKPKMPPAPLTQQQRQQMTEFILFLGENREHILNHAQPEESIWSTLPWWEFE